MKRTTSNGPVRRAAITLVVLASGSSAGSAATLASPSVEPAVRPEEGQVEVHGSVRAESGYPLSHVEVSLRPRGESVALVTTRTDADGTFVLATRSSPAGLEVVAVYPGFDPVIRPLDPAGSSTDAPMALVMQVSRFQDTVVVEAISPTDEALQPQQDFSFLDIVATAGANADPMFATQTLPGVVKLDEGSGLFVRGGDASEVATYLDRALLDHPYRNETPTGGFFGTVDAFELEGLSLSAGGFPARYGNALSAVLELDTREPTATRFYQATVGLAAVSASVETEVGERSHLRLAANRRDATALVDLNDAQLDFREPPSGRDFALRASSRPSQRHRLFVAAYDQTSKLGTELESGNYDGLLDTAGEDRVVNVGWNGSIGSARVGLVGEASVVATWAEHDSDVEIGVLDLASGDRSWRIRAATESPVAGWSIRSGVEAEDVEYHSAGILPVVGGDFEGDQGRRLWSTRVRRRRVGSYLELEGALTTRFALNLGARWDRWSELGASAVDPRGSLSLRLGARSHLRLAWGIYHQSPEEEYFARGVPRDALDLAQAEHRVLSWQYRETGDPFQLRVEAYDKRYDDLPLSRGVTDDGRSVVVSEGDGRAQGLDVFLGFETPDSGPGWRSGWRGFLAYSHLDAERLYTPWQDDQRYPVPSEPFEPDFAIPNTVQLVVHKVLPWAINASLGGRWASGRPSTPVVGTRTVDVGGTSSIVPVYGPINSERLPDFRRLDASASRAFSVGSGVSLLVFVGINDLLDRRNAYRYVYSEDWSERREASTAFGRTIYFGVSFSR